MLQVLTDPQKRKIYDQVGEEGLKGGFGAGGMPGGMGGGRPGGASTAQFRSMEEMLSEVSTALASHAASAILYERDMILLLLSH